MQPSTRLPGVFFETPRPAPPEGLPRMDVTAFVGFAAAGPLHVPVAVEDPARFRDLFGGLDGGAAPLARDPDSGELHRAHLGAAVEGFFANGGARAWVVRVAGGSVVRHRFRLPGLVAAGDRDASPPAAVVARARAAGSWCEELAAGTAVAREPLSWRPGNAVPLELAPGAHRLDLAASPGELAPGDLLELDFAPAALALLLFVDRVEPIPGGVRVHSAPLDPAVGETGGAFWSDGIGDASGGPPVPLAEADGLTDAGALLGSPPDPGSLPAVRRLRFEIAFFRGDELAARLGGLAFARRHPRFWGALPTDEGLFGRVVREQVPDRAARAAAAGAGPDELPSLVAEAFDPLLERARDLAAEAAQPRFPLAGPPPAAAARYYLPWGMARSRAPEAAVPLDRAAPAFGPQTRLERDGLAGFGADLFVDPALAGLFRGSLLAEAEHRHDVRALPLRGLHAVAPVREVSVLAVPDAVHRGWNRELPPAGDPLGAPALLPVGPVDAAGRYPVDWSPVTEATGYRLERDDDPAFPRPVVVYEGDDDAVPMVLPPACPRRIWLRVRAERGGETGPWSNTRDARLPEEPFAPCDADRRTGAPVLVLVSPGSPPSLALAWQQEDPAAPAPDGYELQVASDAGFATARGAGPEPPEATALDLPDGRPEALYYRVRGFLRDGETERPGPWSNTVRVPGSERDDWVEVPEADFEPAALLAVHRSLLRLTAGRGDMLALLSLPRHHRAEDALDHLAALTPGGAADDPEDGSGAAAAGVPPLTRGETPVLGFGALYYPWLVTRGGEDDRALRRQPPDGTVAGSLAAFALGPGAWRAPANRPLAGVLAQEPPLDRAGWQRLAAARINAVVQNPRGFLLLSADTLSADESVRPIAVRRLLTLLRRLALAEGESFVFEPNDPFLAELVHDRFEAVLADLFRRGAFAGDTPEAGFRVVTDASVNPPESRDRGRFVTELRVAPARALAFLTVRLIGGGPERLVVQEVA